MFAHSAADAPPAWFDQAIQNLQEAMRDDLNKSLAPLKRSTARCCNLQCRDGSSCSFEIVPFPDGRLPTVPPHNLPALVNVAAIRALSNADTTAYMNGYGLGAIHSVAERKRAIGQEIGCTEQV